MRRATTVRRNGKSMRARSSNCRGLGTFPPGFRITSAARGPDLPRHDQILEADFLVAGRADGLRPQRLAAAVGELQLRRGSPVWTVAVAPFLEGDQHREQVAAGPGQYVFVARGSRAVAAAFDDPELFELAQAAGEQG